MTDQDMTLGELSRQIRDMGAALASQHVTHDRNFHELMDRVNQAIGPMTESRVRLTRAESDISDLDSRLDAAHTKIDNVTTQAAKLSGGISLLGFIAAIFPWPWKSP